MIEYCRFPVFFAMALSAIPFRIAMEDIFRLVISVTGDAVFQQCWRDLFMPERFKGFDCLFPFVISMALIAGACTETLVKKNLAAVRRQQFACDVFNADIVLFVAAYALYRFGSAKRSMAAQTIPTQCLMAAHQWARSNQHFRESYSQSAENNG